MKSNSRRVAVRAALGGSGCLRARQQQLGGVSACCVSGVVRRRVHWQQQQPLSDFTAARDADPHRAV
jgi:hypothetical protein